MFCQECGKKNLHYAVFCQECGNKLHTPAGKAADSAESPVTTGTGATSTSYRQEPGARGQQPTQEPGQVAQPVKKTALPQNKIFLYSALGVAFLLVLALAAYFFFRPVISTGPLQLIAPEEIIPGDRIIVAIEVENTGRTRGSYQAVLLLNDEEHSAKEVALAAGQQQTVQFELYEEDLGVHTVKLDDNTETFKVLKPAEFASSELSISPNPVNMGNEVTISALVKNVGEATGTHTVNLTIDGEVIQKEEVTLKGNSNRTVSFKVPADKAGRLVVGIDQLKSDLDVYNIQRLANGTYINRDMTGGSGQLIIRNLEWDTLVALTGGDDPKKPLVSVFVRKGSSFTVYGIRDGNYDVYLSMGEDWDTASKRFTKNVSYYRFDETFNYRTTSSHYTYYTISMGEGGGGTRRISQDEFPMLP